MKKAVVVVSLGLLATLSATASADPGFHGRSAGGRFGAHSLHSHGQSFHSHSFDRHGFGHHRFFPGHVVTFGVVVAPPVIVYSSPPVFYAPPAYYAPPAVAYSPAVYSQPPPPPPRPRVVEYPTGRYELRGDGVTTPYMWVWIPNPPPPPAAPPPPPAPPTEAPTSSDRLPARRTQTYHWTDEQGVVHWTDRFEAIPQRYRQEAKTPKS